jgi:hypothetical protein
LGKGFFRGDMDARRVVLHVAIHLVAVDVVEEGE